MQASYRQKCKFTPEVVVYKLVNIGFDMRTTYTVLVQVLPPEKLRQASYKQTSF